MNLVYKLLIIAVNAFVLSYILPGIQIDNFFTAITVAIVLAFLDFLVKPLLILFTLPATIFTLGLFLFVVNGCIILMGDYFVNGFKVQGFWYAVLFSLCLSMANSLVLRQVKKERTYRD